jgi:hypothetical protein
MIIGGNAQTWPILAAGNLIMIDTTYRIIRKPDASYSVVVIQPGPQLRGATGFKSLEQAEAWAELSMTPKQRRRFRRHVERMRLIVKQRPEALAADARELLLTWADELEAELDAERGKSG